PVCADIKKMKAAHRATAIHEIMSFTRVVMPPSLAHSLFHGKRRRTLRARAAATPTIALLLQEP
ncbi:hypothetical protein, partial [uncultured Adlercreutzia sp.]|uniref:hypothetical protein n=1 Tax=uncultured Adlercreutzia sp. TaxID=875803 RepID=UPI0025FA8501